MNRFDLWWTFCMRVAKTAEQRLALECGVKFALERGAGGRTDERHHGATVPPRIRRWVSVVLGLCEESKHHRATHEHSRVVDAIDPPHGVDQTELKTHPCHASLSSLLVSSSRPADKPQVFFSLGSSLSRFFALGLPLCASKSTLGLFRGGGGCFHARPCA